ncbi:MAG: RDD family protein [Steroidobacteraceae bacterium]
MAADELTVRGLTGVDMTLTLAGPGTRSYAFVIDWHIRLLLALAWVLVGLVIRLLVPSGRQTSLTATLIVWAVFVPAIVIYFLYHPLLEVVMRGRTPGKRMAGARIVTREGVTPGTAALLMRNLFRLIDSLPVLYVVGLVCCLVTAQRVRIGDLAAGTVLIIDEGSAGKSLGRLGALLEGSGLKPEAVALVQDLLDRWPDLEPERRVGLARTVLGRLEPESEPAALDERGLHARLKTLLVSHHR